MSLFFVNCERTVLFSVKRDVDPPFTTLMNQFLLTGFTSLYCEMQSDR